MQQESYQIADFIKNAVKKKLKNQQKALDFTAYIKPSDFKLIQKTIKFKYYQFE